MSELSLGFSKMVATLAHTFGGRHLWRVACLVGLAVAVACSSASPTEVSAIVVTRDLTLGVNRVAFGLVDRDGMPLRGKEAQVRAAYLPPGETAGEVRDSGIATFRRWPSGAQGVFTLQLEFDTAGVWELQVDTVTPGGESVTARSAMQVKAQPEAPGIGDPAPASVTPKAEDVDDLKTITTSPVPDPDLYRLSVQEALAEEMPLVLVFATPAFCVTAVCGPQVEVLSQVKDQFSEQANFIHVEVFKDPHLIQSGRPPSGFVPAVSEWRLPTEPFSFIVGRDGTVRAKFEGFVNLEELQEALAGILDS